MFKGGGEAPLSKSTRGAYQKGEGGGVWRRGGPPSLIRGDPKDLGKVSLFWMPPNPTILN